MFKKTVLFCFFAHSTLAASQVVMNEVEEKKFSSQALEYIVYADKKVIDSEKLSKMNLFNRKSVLSEAIYYDEGSLETKKIKVKFQKAFFYEGKLHMSGCYAKLQDGYIEAKNAIYTQNSLEFLTLTMLKNQKLYRKFSYTVSLKDN